MRPHRVSNCLTSSAKLEQAALINMDRQVPVHFCNACGDRKVKMFYCGQVHLLLLAQPNTARLRR